MKYERVSGPTTTAVLLSEVKDHLRITYNQEDSYLQSLIGVATEVAENFLNRKLITQRWDVYFDSFPLESFLQLPFAPVQSLIEISYISPQGTTENLTLQNVHQDFAGSRPLIISKSKVWPPTSLDRSSTLKIRADYGWVSNLLVPQTITHALKLIIADLFTNRTNIPSQKVLSVAESLMYPHRYLRL